MASPPCSTLCCTCTLLYLTADRCLPCAAHAASAAMVLLNKAALSSFDFHAPTALLFFQCLVCCFLVRLFALLGVVRVEPW